MACFGDHLLPFVMMLMVTMSGYAKGYQCDCECHRIPHGDCEQYPDIMPFDVDDNFQAPECGENGLLPSCTTEYRFPCTTWLCCNNNNDIACISQLTIANGACRNYAQDCSVSGINCCYKVYCSCGPESTTYSTTLSTTTPTQLLSTPSPATPSKQGTPTPLSTQDPRTSSKQKTNATSLSTQQDEKSTTSSDSYTTLDSFSTSDGSYYSTPDSYSTSLLSTTESTTLSATTPTQLVSTSSPTTPSEQGTPTPLSTQDPRTSSKQKTTTTSLTTQQDEKSTTSSDSYTTLDSFSTSDGSYYSTPDSYSTSLLSTTESTTLSTTTLTQLVSTPSPTTPSKQGTPTPFSTQDPHTTSKQKTTILFTTQQDEKSTTSSGSYSTSVLTTTDSTTLSTTSVTQLVSTPSPTTPSKQGTQTPFSTQDPYTTSRQKTTTTSLTTQQNEKSTTSSDSYSNSYNTATESTTLSTTTLSELISTSSPTTPSKQRTPTPFSTDDHLTTSKQKTTTSASLTTKQDEKSTTSSDYDGYSTPARSSSQSTESNQTAPAAAPRDNLKSQGINIGIGVGILIFVLCAAIIILLLYWQKQRGVAEKGIDTEKAVPDNSAKNKKIDADEEFALVDGNTYAGIKTIEGYNVVDKETPNGSANAEYADISEPTAITAVKTPSTQMENGVYMGTEINKDANGQEGEKSIKGLENPAYDDINKVIVPGTVDAEYSHLSDATTVATDYQSVKRPNDDMESGEYMDAEKYRDENAEKKPIKGLENPGYDGISKIIIPGTADAEYSHLSDATTEATPNESVKRPNEDMESGI